MAFQYISEINYHIYNLPRGDDWRRKIPVVQSDRSTAFSFTGWAAFAQVRNKIDGTIVIEFDSYDGTIEFDGGNMYLIADKNTTAELSAGEYVWDCQFHDPYGYRRTLIIKSDFQIIGDSSK